MNEMNGTVTLAYVEEDNRQRVIFRVIPLCTREGVLFHGTAEEFPDEGSMRVVPDKREQSTFKERMRGISGLCAICLQNGEGKELAKIRQNRNYSPENGEKNHYAIYSDVICEFADDACFEVIDAGSPADAALTAKVLIRKDMLLYGPVAKEEAAGADFSAIRPFGNDNFLLHTVEVPQIGRHQVYWNAEQLLNWRQRRSGLRKKDKPVREEAPAEEVKAAAEAPKKQEEKPSRKEQKENREPKKPEPKAGKKEPEKENKPAEKRENRRGKRTEEAREAAPQQESALPIGERLEILDSDVSFDQQISRLAQPLSEGANRLSSSAAAPAPEEEEEETVPQHFSGTSLSKSTGKKTSSSARPESVYRVVEKQLRQFGEDKGFVENPVETLRDTVEYIWQNREIRAQAISMLMENEAFVEEITAALRKSGADLQMITAAQEQLSEIEAERIELQMKLNLVKENEKQFTAEAVSRLNGKRREEADRLRMEVDHLRKNEAKLLEVQKKLQIGNAQELISFISANASAMAGLSENGIALTPLIGRKYEPEVLAEALRVKMNEYGFSISEDDAISLMVCFGMFDTVCLKAENPADAYQFASVLLESFGLTSVSAVLHRDTSLNVVNLLRSDFRTPTVSVQPLSADRMTSSGHKTVCIALEEPGEEDLADTLPFPVIPVPRLLRRAYRREETAASAEPASLSVFTEFCSDAHGLLPEAEKWFDELRKALEGAGIRAPESMYDSMRRFVAAASYKMRGGFPLAADMAVTLWAVPILQRRGLGADALSGIGFGLNRSLDFLAGNGGICE